MLDKLDRCSTSCSTTAGWMSRVSLGWLPASYLRLMPAFYRGVSPVIDHDRSSPPGLNGHSTVKPVLPPTLWEELVVEEEDFE